MKRRGAGDVRHAGVKRTAMEAAAIGGACWTAGSLAVGDGRLRKEEDEAGGGFRRGTRQKDRTSSRSGDGEANANRGLNSGWDFEAFRRPTRRREGGSKAGDAAPPRELRTEAA